MITELMDEVIWTDWFMLPPLLLPGAGPGSESQVDVTETKMGISGASQLSQPALRKFKVAHFNGSDLCGHCL